MNEPIGVGARLPELTRTLDLPTMIAYAGATWDWHKLHYDPAYLAERGLALPVVDGQLFGALLAEQLTGWLGPHARLRTLGFRFKALVFAGETVRCEGEVTAVEPTPDGLTFTVFQKVVVTRTKKAGERVAAESTGATVLLPVTP